MTGKMYSFNSIYIKALLLLVLFQLLSGVISFTHVPQSYYIHQFPSSKLNVQTIRMSITNNQQRKYDANQNSKSIVVKATRNTNSWSEEDDQNNNETHSRRKDLVKILIASFLITGTTVGGGFLALPSVVKPIGFLPSAYGLFGVWSYLLLESFIVVDCLREYHLNQVVNVDNSSLSPSSPKEYSGIAKVASSVFGIYGERFVSFLLVLVVEATLVSQLSRAGSLLSSSVNISYRVGCAVSAFSVALIVFGPQLFTLFSSTKLKSSSPESSGLEITSVINSILTSVFFLCAIWLFVCGAKSVSSWSQLLFPISSVKPVTLLDAIPTFLQLLVYGEILPSVCQLLNYDSKKIKISVFIGSFLPLILEVGWAGLGLAMTSSSSSYKTDPVDVLLSTGGPVQLPLFTLAITAILTTILGSYLALQSAFDDLHIFSSVQKNKTSPPNSSSIIPQKQKRKRNLLSSLLLSVFPALGIASVSPDLFLMAIDFAGSFPVLLLWGIAPPLIAWKQRRKSNRTENHDFLIPTKWLKWIAGFSAWLFLVCIT